ncbi:serine/threonine-protein kinase [Sorangium sp. So ce1078]|uniref:serine/threonine-protein kinase n=1 Tax=Sorangium sp. So ce1078 TaxID=3133329 RepID=UPI003F5FB9BC
MSVILAEGTVFARRYRVVRLVAAGGMGAVHEVIHLETDRHRALKVMHPHLFQSKEMRERFKREARIAAKVESEYIVDVSDAGVDEATGMPFLVMELLRGEELGERLTRAGRLPPAEVMTYLHQTALALERTHAASIVHRDLKPANLFLTQREDGSVRVKILDFGIAKLVADSATGAGATSSLGTPIYMSPEQFHGDAKLTAAADIFALGMMAYTLLVGTPYWAPEASSADGVFAFAMVAARGPQEPAVQRARSQGVVLPPGFDAWFARATALDPAARFGRAMEAVQALGEALGVPVDGNPGTSPSAPSRLGVVPVTTAPVPPIAALMTTEPAPARSPGQEPDARSSGLGLAGTSTGAAVSAAPARPRRAGRPPLAMVGLGVLGLGVLLGAGLALRAGRGGEPAAATDAAFASAKAAATGPGRATSERIAPAAPRPATPAPSAAAPQPSVAAPESSATAPALPSSAAAPGAAGPRVPPPAVAPASTTPAPTAPRPKAAPQATTATPAPPGTRPPPSDKKHPSPQPTSTSPYGRY